MWRTRKKILWLAKGLRGSDVEETCDLGVALVLFLLPAGVVLYGLLRFGGALVSLAVNLVRLPFALLGLLR